MCPGRPQWVTFELGLSKTAFLAEGAEQERVLGTLEKGSGSLGPEKGEAGVGPDPDSGEEPWGHINRPYVKQWRA